MPMIDQWKHEEQEPFAGWNFSHLAGRMREDQPPWSYDKRAVERMRHASSLLDMDTGGGERLLELQPHWPRTVVATEHYPPNLLLATERLAPFDVQVFDVDTTETGSMPFVDGAFDLMLNRHGAFNPREVARILAPEGVFLTKQVHGLWGHDLLAAFGALPPWPNATPKHSVLLLRDAGMDIVDLHDWRGHLRFADVGAIVYYLKALPWLVPYFSVDTHLSHLQALQARLDRGEELIFESRTYLIEAHKGQAT